MTNYQEGYKKMSVASVTFLDANTAITATMPNFDTYLAAIKAANTQIATAQVLQEADRSGDTAAKKQLRATLIAQAMDISRRVVAYASNEDNYELRELVNYSEGRLKLASDTKLVSSCQVIAENANANLGALDTYGITDEMISTLQTSITNFSNAIPKGRIDAAASSNATKQLATLFKTLATNWDKIDTLVEMVRTSEPNFYNEYQKVRKVIETGTGSLALRIQTTNAQTGEPEANVTLTLANGHDKIVKKTADGGGSYFKSLADGSYTVTATKPGLKEVAKNVSVVNGELTVLEILMEEA